ncbi:MAG: NAD(P)-dependent oxidoreductase [Lachnospiraceae bacterium]|nr:NAD(P)-dependent oxidoreductase [Lachnospiraceae bacterium]
MKILITGASGFIGKRLLDQFQTKGVSKQNITLLSRNPIPGYQCIIHDNYNIEKEAFQGERFDCIIHGGAVTPKGKGYDDENRYIENIRSTVNLFENLTEIPKKIVFLSSVSVYKESKKIDEQSELTTDNMYALSKIVCERYLNQFMPYGTDVQILRLGAIYGPGEETYNKITGTFLKKASYNEDIIINSSGKENRNMLYVDDAAEYICNAALFEKGIGKVNLVSKESITVFDLAKLVIKVLNSESRIIIENRVKGRNDNYDALKVRTIFDKYEYFTPYESGLVKLSEHFKKYKIL